MVREPARSTGCASWRLAGAARARQPLPGDEPSPRCRPRLGDAIAVAAMHDDVNGTSARTCDSEFRMGDSRRHGVAWSRSWGPESAARGSIEELHSRVAPTARAKGA
jgi:hypothetical protein